MNTQNNTQSGIQHYSNYSKMKIQLNLLIIIYIKLIIIFDVFCILNFDFKRINNILIQQYSVNNIYISPNIEFIYI